MKNLIIASTSTLYGGGYLDYLLPELEKLFQDSKTVLFVPFARPGGISHEAYTEKVRGALAKIGKQVKGVHEFKDPARAIADAEGLFTGGGNTFVLVSQLYGLGLMEPLRAAIEAGVPYLGCSAGSNITGRSMMTTNDMPIMYPPDFRTLGILPFNLNPHYLDADLQSKHMGETRETRIKEFHAFQSVPVLGLREGSWIEVKGEQLTLRGALTARLFQQGKEAVEVETGSDLTAVSR